MTFSEFFFVTKREEEHIGSCILSYEEKEEKNKNSEIRTASPLFRCRLSLVYTYLIIQKVEDSSS